ncbi:MAG: hypothetical protein ACRDIC_22330, partial [bacterium]
VVIFLTDPSLRHCDKPQPAPGNSVTCPGQDECVSFRDYEICGKRRKLLPPQAIPDGARDVVVNVIFVGQGRKAAGIDEDAPRLSGHPGQDSGDAELIDLEGL